MSGFYTKLAEFVEVEFSLLDASKLTKSMSSLPEGRELWYVISSSNPLSKPIGLWRVSLFEFPRIDLPMQFPLIGSLAVIRCLWQFSLLPWCNRWQLRNRHLADHEFWKMSSRICSCSATKWCFPQDRSPFCTCLVTVWSITMPGVNQV
jgi:hypothetical protein